MVSSPEEVKEDFEINISDTNKVLRFMSEKEMRSEEQGELAYMAKRGNVLTTLVLNGLDKYKGYFGYDTKSKL